MKKNEPSEYEPCFRSSAPNNLTESESTLIFLLTMFPLTDFPTTVFSLAKISSNFSSTTPFYEQYIF